MPRRICQVAFGFLLLTMILAFAGPVIASETGGDEPKSTDELTGGAIVERRYCTEYGPFLIRFDRDKAAGIYAIVPNGHLGTMVGSLEGSRIVGRWHEAESAGDIEIEGQDGWKSFIARYRTDANPERWYENWRGLEEPSHRPERFELGDVEYLCERPDGAP